jgi:hypothetical protein
MQSLIASANPRGAYNKQDARERFSLLPCFSLQRLSLLLKIVQAIADARLPVRFSSRPDYSDTIGPDGKPIKQ